MHSRSLFFIFFCSIISSYLILGSETLKYLRTNTSFTATTPSLLEDSIFDFEGPDGKIDRTPIDRFKHYRQFHEQRSPDNDLSQSFIIDPSPTPTNSNSFVIPKGSIATFYANLLDKENKRRSTQTPK